MALQVSDRGRQALMSFAGSMCETTCGRAVCYYGSPFLTSPEGKDLDCSGTVHVVHLIGSWRVVCSSRGQS